jgi:hypothetical protein
MPIHVNVVSGEDFKSVFFSDVMKLNISSITISEEDEIKIKELSWYLNN